jgi:hypothetical protein
MPVPEPSRPTTVGQTKARGAAGTRVSRSEDGTGAATAGATAAAAGALSTGAGGVTGIRFGG